MSNDIKSELPQTTIRLLVNKYGLISGLRFNEHSPDLVFGQPEVVRIKANGGVVIAEGAELEDAARAFWDVVAEWRGDGSRPTLADAQPGGRVRLGDQAERARFEAWHCDKFKTRWLTGAPTRDMHNGVYAENYGPAEQQARWELWQAAWQSALSAQPSPGGQGDERAQFSEGWSQQSCAIGTLLPYEIARLGWDGALAARQPVGEVIEYQSYHGYGGGQWSTCDKKLYDNGKAFEAKYGAGQMSLYRTLVVGDAAPPAQAVDLGPVRALLQRRIEQWRSHLPADPGAPGTREIETKGEHDYNNDVRIYREGIAVMEEAVALIGQTVQAVDLGAVRVLTDHATGRINHANNGLCPDEVEGHDNRDPHCPVCRALIDSQAVGK